MQAANDGSQKEQKNAINAKKTNEHNFVNSKKF